MDVVFLNCLSENALIVPFNRDPLKRRISRKFEKRPRALLPVRLSTPDFSVTDFSADDLVEIRTEYRR
jgi:hypothetical protein